MVGWHQGKKRSKKQGRKGKIYQTECRVPENSKGEIKRLFNERSKGVEDNRMGKTRDIFKKIGDIKGTFHAKIGTIKDRNSKELPEAEEIKRKSQEYTGKLYKKDLLDPVNHRGVMTHLKPDIPECEVKWALGSITMNKASGGDGIPVELFQILIIKKTLIYCIPLILYFKKPKC